MYCRAASRQHDALPSVEWMLAGDRLHTIPGHIESSATMLDVKETAVFHKSLWTAKVLHNEQCILQTTPLLHHVATSATL